MSSQKELPSPQEATALLEPIDSDIVQKAIVVTRHIVCEDKQPFSFVKRQKAGTGIQTGKERVITASHILNRLLNPSVTVIDNQIHHRSGRIIRRLKITDIAVMEIEECETLEEQIEIQPDTLNPNQTLLLTAFPSPFHKPYVFRGLYLEEYRNLYPDDKHRLQKTFVFYHSVDPAHENSSIRDGFSGGGVFDTKGVLVGMIIGEFTNGEPKGLALNGALIHHLLISTSVG